MTNQPAHRIEMGRPIRTSVDSHGPGAEVEIRVGARVARVRTRRHGKAFTTDQMIAAAFAQLGITPPIKTYHSDRLGRVTIPE